MLLVYSEKLLFKHLKQFKEGLGGLQFTTRGLHFEKIITIHYCDSIYVLHSGTSERCKFN